MKFVSVAAVAALAAVAHASTTANPTVQEPVDTPQTEAQALPEEVYDFFGTMFGLSEEQVEEVFVAAEQVQRQMEERANEIAKAVAKTVSALDKLSKSEAVTSALQEVLEAEKNLKQVIKSELEAFHGEPATVGDFLDIPAQVKQSEPVQVAMRAVEEAGERLKAVTVEVMTEDTEVKVEKVADDVAIPKSNQAVPIIQHADEVEVK